jgi:hypothetical protein
MKSKILYIISVIVIALPWLFLLEVLPVPYYKVSTAAEVAVEGIMFAALLVIVILLKKKLKNIKAEGGRTDKVISRILFVLTSVTLFVVGLILSLIAISFTLL